MLVLIAYGFFWNCYLVTSVLVNTTTGPVMGKIVVDDIIGVSFKAFEGIPFAEPPIGELRFKPPIPVKSWAKILNATTVRYACPQMNLFNLKEEINENCLFLNIFTPTHNRLKKLLPVMIFVYGGNFRWGSASPNDIYGPQLILKNKIVVAAMNYRLGSLGFLSLDNADASGNAGIKDVLLAIEWIHNNTEKFDGDPNQITIAGQSAGAVIIQFLMLTKKSNGLFQKAILFSGNAISQKFIQRNPKNNAREIGKELGLKWSNDKNLLQQLKKVKASALLTAEERMIQKDPRKGIRIHTPFSASIEIESTSAIVTDEPLQYIKKGKMRNIPSIIGITNQEGLEMFAVLKLDSTVIKSVNENFELCIPTDIDYSAGSQKRKKVALCIRDFYFHGGNISIFNTQNYINLITDAEFSYSTNYLIELLKERKDSAPLYYSFFAFDGELNWFKRFENITYPGACHGDDIGYIFVPENFRTQFNKLNAKTKHFILNFQRMLVNFIKHGDPTPKRFSNGISWPEAGKSKRHLIIDECPRVVWHEPYPERTNFWRKIYEEYYQDKRINGLKFSKKLMGDL